MGTGLELLGPSPDVAGLDPETSIFTATGSGDFDTVPE